MTTLTSEIGYGEKILNRLKSINELVETIYVDESSGEISICKTIKEYNSVRNITEKIIYMLKSHRILVKEDSCDNSKMTISDQPLSQTICINRSPCQCASYDIMNIFISEISKFKNVENSTYNFFKQGFFKKLLNENSEYDLIERILKNGKNSSWIIVSKRILNIIKNSDKFHSNKKKTSIGHLDNMNIYLNPNMDDDNVYYGNYDSMLIIINRNIKEEDTTSPSYNREGMNITIEYCFVETGNVKILNIK
jgi:hypothetical protein